MDHRGSSDLVLEILEELKDEVNKIDTKYGNLTWATTMIRVKQAIQNKIDQFKSKA